jgi:hypothetical protein
MRTDKHDEDSSRFPLFCEHSKEIRKTPQAPLHLQGQISYGNIAAYSDRTRNSHAVWPNCRFIISVPVTCIHIGLLRVDMG